MALNTYNSATGQEPATRNDIANGNGTANCNIRRRHRPQGRNTEPAKVPCRGWIEAELRFGASDGAGLNLKGYGHYWGIAALRSVGREVENIHMLSVEDCDSIHVARRVEQMNPLNRRVLRCIEAQTAARNRGGLRHHEFHLHHTAWRSGFIWNVQGNELR